MNEKIFISYSHKDKDAVLKFAQQLSLYGFDLWIDEKDIPIGSNYTTRIFSGIYESDIYMVFVSENSMDSAWVNAEIDYALSRNIEGGKLQLIPVKLDNAELPLSIRNLDYLDARFSIENAIAQFTKRVIPLHNSDTLFGRAKIVNIGFTISESTDVEIGPFNGEMTVEDLEQNKIIILEKLRKRAYGILMNFVSISDFDFTASVPKFMNGIYTEDVAKVAGSTSGSIREKIKIVATVFNPDEKKVYRLLNNRIEILNVNEVAFGFIVPLINGRSMKDIREIW